MKNTWIFGIFIFLFLLVSYANAATYNFYFSDPESGPKMATQIPSQSTYPEAPPEAPVEAPPQPVPPAPESAPTPPPAATSKEEASHLPDNERTRIWAIDLSGGMMKTQKAHSRQLTGSSHFFELGLALWADHWLGIRALFGGQVMDGQSQTLPWVGLEAEVIPLRLNLFGEENLIQVGLLGGATSLGSFLSGQTHYTLHGGGRVALNLRPSLAFTSTVRANHQHVQGSAGVQFRL